MTRSAGGGFPRLAPVASVGTETSGSANDLDQVAVVGFIGLGAMGRPMARQLAAAGWELILFDSEPDHARGAAQDADGRTLARVATEASDLAGCSVVITMLPTSEAVWAALIEGGIAAALRPGTLVIDMSSSEPNATRRLGKELGDCNVGLVDAPVSGGVARAETGSLTIITGGDEAAVARARPLLEVMGARIFHVGGLGAAHAVKSLNNVLSACGLLMSTEVTDIARRFGVDPVAFIDLINQSTGRNDATENKIARYVLSRRFDSGFTAGLMLKDLKIARSLARSTGAPSPFLSALVDAWEDATAAIGAGADQTEVARHVEGK